MDYIAWCMPVRKWRNNFRNKILKTRQDKTRQDKTEIYVLLNNTLINIKFQPIQ